MKEDSYWLSAAEDIRRFRKGLIPRVELAAKYPELQIQQTGRGWEAIEDAIRITIPKECPLHCAAEIAFSTPYEPNDKCLAQSWLCMEVAFRPEWRELKQTGRLEDICAQEEDVVFDCSVGRNAVKLMECIKEGGRGDEDGYGIEDDTWLVAYLTRKGEWKTPFFIVD